MLRTNATLLAVALAGSVMSPDVRAADAAPSSDRATQAPASARDAAMRPPAGSDDSSAVSLLVDSDGATLTATAEDGTHFVLTVPPDAIALPLLITMTPSSARRPGGGWMEVRIEPEGAFLWQPADLKILPPTPPDLETLGYFRSGGPDDGFTFYPGTPGSTDIEMPVSYLATYGAFAEGAGKLDAKRLERAESTRPLSFRSPRAATGALAPYISRAAHLFRQEQAHAIDEATYKADVFALWNEAWTNVVSPALDGLGDSCDQADLAPVLQTALEFLGLDDLAGDPAAPGYRDTIGGVAKDRAVQCIELHYQLCRSAFDPTQVILILAMERWLGLSGYLTGELFADIQAKVTNCLHFEIDFDSTVTVGNSIGGGSITDRMKVRAIVPVHLEYVTVLRDGHLAVKPVLLGDAPIERTFSSILGSPCTYSSVAESDTFTVLRLGIDFWQSAESGETAAAPRDRIPINMFYATGDPEENLIQNCPAGSAGVITVDYPYQPVFAGSYGYLHVAESLDEEAFGPWTYQLTTPPDASDAPVGASPGATFGGWAVRGYWELVRSGQAFAKADYLRTVPFPPLQPISEETHILLKHTPQ